MVEDRVDQIQRDVARRFRIALHPDEAQDVLRRLDLGGPELGLAGAINECLAALPVDWAELRGLLNEPLGGWKPEDPPDAQSEEPE